VPEDNRVIIMAALRERKQQEDGKHFILRNFKMSTPNLLPNIVIIVYLCVCDVAGKLSTQDAGKK
jgi:hypothetical protein